MILACDVYINERSVSAIYFPSPVKTVGRVVTGNVRTNPRSTRSQRGVIAGSAVDESLRAPIEYVGRAVPWCTESSAGGRSAGSSTSSPSPSPTRASARQRSGG